MGALVSLHRLIWDNHTTPHCRKGASYVAHEAVDLEISTIADFLTACERITVVYQAVIIYKVRNWESCFHYPLCDHPFSI